MLQRFARLANTQEPYARVCSQPLKSGSSWRVNFVYVRKDLRRRIRWSGTGWPCRAGCYTISESGVQWIASALKQRNPDRLPISLKVAASGPLAMVVAGDAIKTECD